jgi:PAS domain S-box-containing protein
VKPHNINFRSLKAAVVGSVILVLAMAALLVGLDRRERAQQSWVNHTYEVILLVRNIIGSVSSAEIAVRGYVITGNESNLSRYAQAADQVEDQLASLRSLISDNPRQISAAAAVTNLVLENFSALKGVVDETRAGGRDAGAALVDSDADTSLERKVRAALLDMQDHELLLLSARQGGVTQARNLTNVAIVLLALLATAWVFASLRYSMKSSVQRHVTEKLLVDSERRFRLLADNSTDIIAHRDFDSDGMTYFSPAVRDVLGWSPDDLYGSRWMELIHPDDFEAVMQMRRATAADHPSLNGLFRIRHKNGHYIWIEVHGRYVPATNDMRASVQSTWRDVTARKAAEDDAVKARNDADKANKAKSDFLAMMSHELRTPMAGVLGIADLLLMEEGDFAERKRMTKQLKRSALSLLDILNDILDFSKIEAGKLDITHEPFSLGDVLADLRGLFGPAASAKGIVFEVSTADGLPDGVKGDAKRLRQIMVNLVNNALKFTSQGRVDLHVDFVGVGDGAIELQGYVRDTGIGISKETIAKLFKPFVQADASTSRTFGGTGLGLTIARLLASAMKGRIWVESELGQGATFHFAIPLETAATVLVPAIRHDRRTPDAARKQRPLNILLAEDTDTVRQVVETMLKRMGHSVDAVENGSLAVERARQNNYDIILLDMQMPVMDGLEATKAIRAFQSTSMRTPIIALTADAIYEHREKYIAGGVDAIVTKPINWEILVEKFARFVPDVAVPVMVDRRKSGVEIPAVHPINDALLRELGDAMGPDALGNFFKSFRASVSRYQGEIQTALAADDLKNAKKSAHALKGLSSQMGADRLAATAAYIEVTAGSLDEARRHVADLRAAADQTLSEIAGKYEWASVA